MGVNPWGSVRGTDMTKLSRQNRRLLGVEGQALTLLVVLRRLAEAVRSGRNPSVAVLHAPLELVALALGVHRSTVWRYMRVLAKAGWATYRPHQDLADPSRRTGSVWAVRLRGRGRVRLLYEDLAHPWRDLEADIRAGRTSYRAIREGQARGFTREDWARLLLAWATGQRLLPHELDQWRPPAHMLDLYDLLTAPERERAALVGLYALVLAEALRDKPNQAMYARLLWGLIRSGSESLAGLLWAHILAVLRDCTRLRSPGAALVAGLKRSGLWYRLLAY